MRTKNGKATFPRGFGTVNAMLKYAHKTYVQRKHKPIAKHANSTAAKIEKGEA